MTDGHSLFLPLINTPVLQCLIVYVQYSKWMIVCFFLSISWFRGNSIVDRDSRPQRRPDERSPGKVVEPRGFISIKSTNQIRKNILFFLLFPNNVNFIMAEAESDGAIIYYVQTYAAADREI